MTESQSLTDCGPREEDSPARISHGAILLRRLRFLCAIAVSAAMFWYVGWRVVKPVDPAGPVSLLMADQSVMAMAQLLGLAVAAAGLAVAICGAGCADRGPMAVAVGLATLGLRGSQLDALAMYRMHPPSTLRAAADPYPAAALMAECWLWLALIAVGFIVGRWVDSWFTQPRAAQPNISDRRGSPRRSSDVRYHVAAVIVGAMVAWVVLSYALGSDKEPILKGQVYFAVGVAFWAAALVAHALFKTTSRVWSLFLVAVVASAAYFLAGPDHKSIVYAGQTGTYLNIPHLARPLPIEYAAMGALGALWERDWMRLFRAILGMSTDDGATATA